MKPLLITVAALSSWVLVVAPVAAHDCAQPIGRWPFGTAHVIDFEGDLGVMNSGTAVVVVDLSTPNSPRELGAWDSGTMISHLLLFGDYAFASLKDDSLRVLDLSVPSEPVEVTRIDGVSYRTALAGSLLLISGGEDGLRIMDVSNPAQPQWVGSLVVPGVSLGDVAVQGDIACFEGYPTDLLIVDISIPSAPVLRGTYTSSEANNTSSSVELSDSTAFVGYRWRVRSVDISNPDSPVEVGVLGGLDRVRDLELTGSLLHVANHNSGFSVIDVSDPAAMVELARLEFLDTAISVAANGNRALVAAFSEGGRVIDVSNPSLPTEIGVIDVPGRSENLAIDGDFCAVTVGRKGVRIIDVSDPTAPVTVGGVDVVGHPLGHARGLDVSDGFAYVTTTVGMHVIDIDSPGGPVEIGMLGTPYPFDVAVQDHLAFIAKDEFLEYPAGVLVADVTDPFDPVALSLLPTNDTVYAVAVDLPYVYAAARGAGLRVIDASDPAFPVEVGFVDIPIYARDVDLAGSYAYVAGGAGGLRIINVMDPAAPTEIGFVEVIGSAYHVAVSGSWAWVVEQGGWVYLVDVSRPVSAAVAMLVPPWANDVAARDGLAFTANGGIGMTVHDSAACEGLVFADDFEHGFLMLWSSTVGKVPAATGAGL